MNIKKRYRRRSHGVSMLHAHIVTCTKYRRRVLTRRVFEAIRTSMRRAAAALGVDLVALEVEGDHVHLMIEYPPTRSLGEITRRLKGASSRAVRLKRFGEVLKKLWGAAFWSPSYFVVSCGGAPLETVKAYAENQQSDAHLARRASKVQSRTAARKSNRTLDPRSELRGLRL